MIPTGDVSMDRRGYLDFAEERGASLAKPKLRATGHALSFVTLPPTRASIASRVNDPASIPASRKLVQATTERFSCVLRALSLVRAFDCTASHWIAAM